MNKLLLSAALVAGVAGGGLTPRGASASDGAITVNGTLTAQTCVVAGGSPGNVTVKLPTVSVSSLKTPGLTAGRTPFTISLSNCTGSGNIISTFFEPGPTVMADGNLTNTGNAPGVEVQLLNTTAKVMNLSAASGNQSSSSNLFGSGGVITGLTYYAQYYAAGPVGNGTVTTTVQFTMTYA